MNCHGLHLSCHELQLVGSEVLNGLALAKRFGLSQELEGSLVHELKLVAMDTAFNSKFLKFSECQQSLDYSSVFSFTRRRRSELSRRGRRRRVLLWAIRRGGLLPG